MQMITHTHPHTLSYTLTATGPTHNQPEKQQQEHVHTRAYPFLFEYAYILFEDDNSYENKESKAGTQHCNSEQSEGGMTTMETLHVSIMVPTLEIK